MRLILCTLTALVILLAQGTALANNSAEQRYDVQEALAARIAMLRQVATRLSPAYLARVNKVDQKWATSGAAIHTKYIMQAYPFYDFDRARAITIMHQSLLLSEIVKAKDENLEKIVKAFENNKLFDFYIVKLAKIYEEEAIERFKQSIGLVSEIYLHCTYDNYDTARDIAVVLSDAFFEAGSKKFGAPLGFGMNINRETMDCKFRGNVKNFSTSYFSTSILTGDKFFKQDTTKQISSYEEAHGITIDSNTINSYLDFFVVHLDIEVDKKICKEIYTFQVNREGKKVYRIDSEYFLNTIALQYNFNK